MLVSGIKFKSPSLVASTCTRWAILLAGIRVLLVCLVVKMGEWYLFRIEFHTHTQISVWLYHFPLAVMVTFQGWLKPFWERLCLVHCVLSVDDF